MSRIHEVLIAPLVTEKSTYAKENLRTLAFRVARGASKQEIKEAVERIFKVKVASVRTSNMHGKVRRQGRYLGRRPDWKKAYVTLREGEKMIEFTEAL